MNVSTWRIVFTAVLTLLAKNYLFGGMRGGGGVGGGNKTHGPQKQ